jgi:predicted transposase/invertase (TIGR01784 family)
MEFSWVLESDARYDALDNRHDKGYKYLLSVKKVFVELLRSFVNQGWVNKIDENDIERIDKSFILKDFREKEADLIYRVKLDGREVFFYLLLELQSTVDFQMPYRLLQYMMGIWSGILNDTQKNIVERKDFKLPVIVPCVLYNGRDNWTVCKSFRETLEAYELFDEYILNFRYILFDVKRYDENKLLELANVIGAAFFIDQQPEYDEVIVRIQKLMAQLTKLNEEEQLLFVTWFKNVIIRRIPRDKAEELEKAIESSKEGGSVIYAIEEAVEKEFQKREQRGMEKGMEKGIEKTARNLLGIGMAVEQVGQVTGLTIERVLELNSERN